MSDQAGAIWQPNNNFFLNRNGIRPGWIILHGTAGGTSAVAMANYFASTQGTANPVTSHYIIDRDGVVVQTVLEKDGAWANGFESVGHDPWWVDSINPNNQTISIEHVKSALDNSDVLTAKQQAASFQLVHDICQRWKIPMRAADASGGITGHYSMDPVNRKNCPGPYPLSQLWDFLGGKVVTQADYDKVYNQLAALQKAWNIVVPEKNELAAQVVDLRAQLARAQSTSNTTMVNAINQAIAILQKSV